MKGVSGREEQEGEGMKDAEEEEKEGEEEEQKEEEEKGLEGLKELLHRILEELTTENPKSRARRSRSQDSLKPGVFFH